MSIEREDGEWIVCCTKCGEGVELDSENFAEVVGDIRDLGWKVFKDKWGTWNHVCSKCTEGLKC